MGSPPSLARSIRLPAVPDSDDQAPKASDERAERAEADLDHVAWLDEHDRRQRAGDDHLPGLELLPGEREALRHDAHDFGGLLARLREAGTLLDGAVPASRSRRGPPGRARRRLEPGPRARRRGGRRSRPGSRSSSSTAGSRSTTSIASAESRRSRRSRPRWIATSGSTPTRVPPASEWVEPGSISAGREVADHRRLEAEVPLHRRQVEPDLPADQLVAGGALGREAANWASSPAAPAVARGVAQGLLAVRGSRS